MSFSSNKRDALDSEKPLEHRMSHVRSCAMHLGQKFKVHRDEIIKRVQELTGVDVNSARTEEDAIKAIDALLHIKDRGLSEPFDSKA